MTVDFNKEANILAIHGVQTSTDDKIESDKQITKLVNRSLDASHIQRDFSVDGFFYEDINDKAQSFYKLIAQAITLDKPLVGDILKNIIDAAGDVVTAASNTSTARLIKDKLRNQILDTYANGNQLILVAHSLGTIYALDVICELMKDANLFKGDDKTTWPVQGYISMGSPLGLDIELGGMRVFDKRSIEILTDANYSLFPWHNYYNRLDPVVSGNIFGAPIEIKGSKGPVEKRYGSDTMAAKWLLQGHAVASGKQWLLAHTSYWKNSKIGDNIVSMLWG